jgi:calcineurin-like phosphoesterase
LPLGTAYLTDIGMTGSYAGVIGMNKSDVIARFTSATAGRAGHASGDVRILAAVIEVEETTGTALRIERLDLPHVA